MHDSNGTVCCSKLKVLIDSFQILHRQGLSCQDCTSFKAGLDGALEVRFAAAGKLQRKLQQILCLPRGDVRRAEQTEEPHKLQRVWERERKIPSSHHLPLPSPLLKRMCFRLHPLMHLNVESVAGKKRVQQCS